MHACMHARMHVGVCHLVRRREAEPLGGGSEGLLALPLSLVGDLYEEDRAGEGEGANAPK